MVAISNAPPKSKESPGYEILKNHDPDGIGKFYMGREIAQVMKLSESATKSLLFRAYETLREQLQELVLTR